MPIVIAFGAARRRRGPPPGSAPTRIGVYQAFFVHEAGLAPQLVCGVSGSAAFNSAAPSSPASQRKERLEKLRSAGTHPRAKSGFLRSRGCGTTPLTGGYLAQGAQPARDLADDRTLGAARLFEPHEMNPCG